MTAKLADFGNITVAGNMMTPNFGSLESKINERSQEYMYQYDIAANLELGMLFPRTLGVRLPFFFGFMENYTTPKYNPFDQDILLKDAVRNMTSFERDSLYRMVLDYKQRLSFNFTNVRVAANSMEQKVFHPSNLSLGFAYSRMFARNAKIDHQEDINYHVNLAYAYNVQPFYIDVFKNVSWLKSKYLRLIGDFNFNPYPNQFDFTTNINRTYNEVQFRSVVAPEVKITPTAAKDFTWDRSYRMMWDITRSLKLEFNANNRARIDEPEGIINKRLDPEGYRHWYDSTWTNFWRMGRNVQYYHRYDLTWTPPINKIPLLEWTSGRFHYGGSYDWQAAPILKDNTYNPGNTIANSRNITATIDFSFESLYNKVPFLRRINDDFSGRIRRLPVMIDVDYERVLDFTANNKRTIRHKLNTERVKTTIVDADGKEIKGEVEIVDENAVSVTLNQTAKGVRVKVTGRVPKKQNPVDYAGKALVRAAMLVRNLSITYNSTDATTLPGFMPGSQILGMNHESGWAPGWGFVFGDQNEDFVEKARRMHWLSQDTTIISPFSMSHTNTWTFRMILEPFRDFRIELRARRSYSENKLSYNVAEPSVQRQITGNFNISVLSITTAFENPKAENDYYSKAFQTFLDNRAIVANRLARSRAAASSVYTGAIDPDTKFPEGYSPLSAEVLIPSFLAAYTGRPAGKVTLSNFFNIPLPNWQITYNGLSRLKALKDIITSATLLHSYQSTYAVNAYTLNQNYEEGVDGFSYVRNALNDFIAQRDILNVGITESFSPLLQVDLDWFNVFSTRMRWNKSRTVGLSMANNQITERRTNEWEVQLGYTFREFPVLFTFMSNRTSRAKTMLRLQAGLSVQDDLNILRNIAQDDSGLPQLADGKQTVSIKCSADYTVSSSIMLRLFFDRVVNTPRVSTVGTANTNAGLSINILLAQ
ncbi:MAG: cell surface protein SprA, partial [Prevotellaceae bacterium]|jgi:cell surface protein SprA|nr:cell surface protein SprA [Prevotellaceae bacterium]